MAVNGDDMENEGGPTYEAKELSPSERHLANVEAFFDDVPFEGTTETPLDDGSLGMASYIQLARIYDACTLLLMHFDEESAARMVELHERGEFVGPDPALAADEEVGEA